MARSSARLRLYDIVNAIDHVRAETERIILDECERDWRKRWVIERSIEIISEASRRFPPELQARYPGIPWSKIAGIGNVLRHDYEKVAAEVLWNVAREELPHLEEVCRKELAALGEGEPGSESGPG